MASAQPEPAPAPVPAPEAEAEAETTHPCDWAKVLNTNQDNSIEPTYISLSYGPDSSEFTVNTEDSEHMSFEAFEFITAIHTTTKDVPAWVGPVPSSMSGFVLIDGKGLHGWKQTLNGRKTFAHLEDSKLIVQFVPDGDTLVKSVPGDYDLHRGEYHVCIRHTLVTMVERDFSGRNWLFNDSVFDLDSSLQGA